MILLSILSACSPTYPTPTAPSADQGSQVAPSAPSQLLPAEKLALEAVQKVLDSSAPVDSEARADLGSFLFSSEEALRRVEKMVLEEGGSLSDGLRRDAATEQKCLFLSELFWSRIQAAESAPNPTQAWTAMRPWLADLMASNSKVFQSRARLALLLQDEWKQPDEDASAYRELQGFWPIPCSSDAAALGLGESGPALQEQLVQRVATYMQLLRANGNLDDVSPSVAAKFTPRQRILNKTQFFADLSQDPRQEVVRNTLNNLMTKTRLSVRPSPTQLMQSNPEIPPMSWRFEGVGELGRCLRETPSLEGTSLANYELGKRCSLGGGPEGYFSLGITALKTSRCMVFPPAGMPESLATSDVPCFSAELFSVARGGHRNGVPFGPGDEDETTNIHYNVVGSGTIPQCNNPMVCDPLLILQYEHSQTDTNNRPVTSLGASDFIELESPSLGGTIRLAPDTPTIIDRSHGPISVRIHLQRNFSHVGTAGEAPTLFHTLTLSMQRHTELNLHLSQKQQEPLAQTERSLLRSIFGWAAYHLEHPEHPLVNGISGWLTQLTRGIKLIPATFENQLLRIYAPLYLIQSVLDERKLSLNSIEMRQLHLAQQALSDEARTIHLPTLRYVYKDRKELLALVPEAPLSDEIARLMTFTNDEGISLDDGLASLQPVLNVLSTRATDPAVAALLQDIRQANRKHVKLLEAIVGLTKIREDLVALRKKIESEMLLFAREISDLTGETIQQ